MFRFSWQFTRWLILLLRLNPRIFIRNVLKLLNNINHDEFLFGFSFHCDQRSTINDQQFFIKENSSMSEENFPTGLDHDELLLSIKCKLAKEIYIEECRRVDKTHARENLKIFKCAKWKSRRSIFVAHENKSKSFALFVVLNRCGSLQENVCSMVVLFLTSKEKDS